LQPPSFDRLSNLSPNETILVVRAVQVNDEFDAEADPGEDKDFIGFAYQGRKPSAMPSIQETAIDMQGIEPMLNVQKSCYHVLSSVRPSKRAF
jgi:hypothetical protein